ncbi:MAG TPA: hypothetical protein VKV05_02165 [Terriglobales bacterium]|nr:hypothetical protein [Terriglobales bacterium]
MARRLFAIVMTGLCLLALAGVEAAAASSRSTVGTWKLDVAKSSYGKMPPPKAEQLVITTDQPDAVAWKLIGASADGKTYISMYNGPIDGKYHPMTGSEAGDTVAYSRTASGLAWMTKDKSGTVISQGSNQLSPDGGTLVVKGTVQGPKGKENFVSVFERVQ